MNSICLPFVSIQIKANNEENHYVSASMEALWETNYDLMVSLGFGKLCSTYSQTELLTTDKEIKFTLWPFVYGVLLGFFGIATDVVSESSV